MSQLQEIYSGWKQWVNREDLSRQQRALIEKRLWSCRNCHHMKEHWVTKVISSIVDLVTRKKTKTREKQWRGFLCGLCHCPLDQKTMTWESECPLPTYNGVTYGDQKRWGRVRFNEEGKLLTLEAIYITEPTSGLEGPPPVQP